MTSNQCLFDIAILEDGNVLSAFEWALSNGISITDELLPGQNLINPNSGFKETDVVNYFKIKKHNLGTAITANNLENLYEFPQGDFPISF